MGATTDLQLPYPEPTDANDVAGRLKSLADRLEVVLLQRFTQRADADKVYAKAPTGGWTRTYPRGTGSDNYTGNAGLLGGTWADAPAGDYLLHTTLVLTAGVNTAGELHVFANNTEIGSTRWDAPAAAAVPATVIYPFSHSGGNLPVAVTHSVGAGTGTVTNSGSKATLQYLGPRPASN